MRSVLAASVALMLINTPPVTAEPGGDHGRHHGHHDFPAAVVKFHDVMAPLWHAQPGAARAGRTCAQSAQLRSQARDIVAADAPPAASDAGAWKAAAEHLNDTAALLEKNCAQANGDAEAGLAELHRAFHGLVHHIGHRH